MSLPRRSLPPDASHPPLSLPPTRLSHVAPSPALRGSAKGSDKGSGSTFRYIRGVFGGKLPDIKEASGAYYFKY